MPLYVANAQGPLCADYFTDPTFGDKCDHESCYRIAYRIPPAHDCNYETFLDDPITVAYGASGMIGLISCVVCDAYARASEGNLS